MTQRRTSESLHIGNIEIGAGAPISVQSMTKTNTRDAASTVEQILRLEDCGCEIIRVAVPDMEAANAISDVKRRIHIPLIADIHFDHRLALKSLEAGVDGLRLNPGNIRDQEHIAAVVRSAKERDVPIRVGVNAGSLPPKDNPMASHVLGNYPADTTNTVMRMVEAALWEIHLLESLDFDLIKVSLKAFDIHTTVAAYQLMAQKVAYPLHVGITEAGLPWSGAIRSALGIGTLLYQGIGDTIRVSLTGAPEDEVIVAWEILKGLGLRQHGPTLVSCPTCGRCEVDLVGLAISVNEHLKTISKPIKVAVMGCVVNGPGEAKDADVGIACGKDRGIIFKKGEKLRTVEKSDFLNAIVTEIDSL